MKLLLLFTYFFFKQANEPVVVQEVEIPQQPLNPAAGAAAVRKPDVLIKIDDKGMVTAAMGDEKLKAFDATQAGKMKPLDDWLAKVGKKGELLVAVRVHGDTKQGRVTDLLNVFAKQGIKKITFTDLLEE